MSSLKPVYIVPLLVEQSTWGGEYIATTKQITHALTQGKKVGQAFELYSDTLITSQPNQNFAYATATNLSQPQLAEEADVQSLQDLIEQHPEGVLGEKAISKGWTTMQVLIKFTQAQNNSYQVHVIPGKEFGKWLPKPESWYYFEQGKATLGLSEPTQVEAYKARSVEIDTFAQQVSQEIKSDEITLEQGKQKLKEFIDQDHPRKFVHTLTVPAGSVIDLSQGGIHHSWEMGDVAPQGNIVYEVQVNVMDEFCTLRSFDQGNIKDDGSVRPLTIDDYFTALDLDQSRNQPEYYLSQVKVEIDQAANVKQLFSNQYYTSEEITFSKEYSGKYTSTEGSFHHIYAHESNIVVHTDVEDFPVQAGWSLFIPASVKNYQLSSQSSTAKVITTHL